MGKTNLLNHAIKQHYVNLLRKIEGKCFSPHSKASGFRCKLCNKNFINTRPDFSRDAEFPQVKEIQKMVNKVKFSNVVTRKVLEQNTPKKNKTLVQKIKRLPGYVKRSHLSNSINRSFAKITGGNKKRDKKVKKRIGSKKSLLKKKISKNNATKLDNSDINENSLESLLESNSSPGAELDENLNESFELFESSIVEENEVSNFRNRIMKQQVGINKNILDQLNLSDDTNDFV